MTPGRTPALLKDVSPYLIGAVGGVVVTVLCFMGLRAVGNYLDGEGFGVTPEAVQLAAVNEYLETRGLSAGGHVSAFVEFGGGECGGVVEVRIFAGSELLDDAVFIVTQDSGQGFASEVPGVGREEAKARLESQTTSCF